MRHCAAAGRQGFDRGVHAVRRTVVVQEIGQRVARGQVQRGHGLARREFREIVFAVVHDQAVRPRRGLGLGHAFQGRLHVVQPGAQGQAAAEFVGAQRLGLVKAHPDGGGQAGREAREPHVHGLVGGAGLAADVVALEHLVRAGGGAADRDAAQDVVHDPGGAGIDGARQGVAGDDRLGLHQHVARAVGDAVHQIRGDAVAAVGEHAVAVDHLQRRGAARAQRQRQHGRPTRLVEAEAGQVVLRILRRDGLQDADRHHVLGPHETLAQGQHGLVLVAVVLGLPGLGAGLLRGQHEGLVGDLRGRGQAAFQRRRVDEGLDVGAGLAPGLRHAVEAAAVVVEAADHGADGAVLRHHRDQRRLQRRHVDDFPAVAVLVDVDDRAAAQPLAVAGLGVERARHHCQRLLVADGDDVARAARQRDFGGAGGQHHGGQQIFAVRRLFLHAVEDFIQRGRVFFNALGQVDLVLGARIHGAARVVQHAVAHGAVGGFLVLGIDGGVDVDALGVGLFLEHAVHELARQFGRVVAVDREAARAGAVRAANRQALLERLVGLFGREIAQRLHAAQHVVLTDLGAREIGDGVEARRGLGDAGEHGGLGRRDFRQGLAQIGARGGRETIGAVAQVDLVHVELKDLVLGELGFDLERQQQFIELARISLFRRQVEIARHLHRDGAAALALGALDEVGHDRARHPHPVDAAVAVEAVVLGCQHRLAHHGRDLVKAQHVAVLFAVLADQDLVRRIDAQRHPRTVVRHGVQVGQAGPGQGQRQAERDAAAHGGAAGGYARLDENAFPGEARFAARGGGGLLGGAHCRRF
ncbi:hypothetical protein LMG3410_04177 [Achromobacter aegrifaciens]|nr:hypothetical protein LMG3410_04177 [Achromobacter aegrifaciens]